MRFQRMAADMRRQHDVWKCRQRIRRMRLLRVHIKTGAGDGLIRQRRNQRLLVDDREDVGGITYCRMDVRIIAPLPHVVASFFARRPYKRKAGHYPNWNGFYLLLYRDVEGGWKLVRIRRDTSYAQFVPVFAARVKAVEEINKLRGKE